jgi:MFS family permease
LRQTTSLDTIRHGIGGQQWRALFAAQTGYMLDAMDVLLYVFAVNTLKAEFHLTNAQAGLVSSATLICSAIGGIACGVLADRVGRTKTLVYTILLYSLASGGTALSTGLASLILWRGLVGIGLGGQWSAGAVLVAETWPAQHRAKAIGFMQSGWALGYLLAAGVTALVLPRFGWRVLFLTGLLPSLVAIAIRRGVDEPEIWKRRDLDTRHQKATSLRDLFVPLLLRRTVLATLLTTSVLFAYWGLFTWLPGFLSAPSASGGAGLSVLRTSVAIVPMQIGAFLGYNSFGWVADRFGRRPAFVTYMLAAAALVPMYGMARTETALLALGPFIGFFGSGYFSLFGAMLAELYPTRIRATGQGFTYNAGRGLSALAPLLVGTLADRNGIGAALGVSSGFFLLGAILIFTLPDQSEPQL